VSVYYSDDAVTLHHGHALDVLKTLPDGSVNCCVTSPPYFGLRSYLPSDHPDKAREYGAEPSPAEYVESMRVLFAEVRRVLADDGTLWLNLGDSYSAGNGTKTNGPQQSRNGKGVCGPRDMHPSAARASLTRSFAEVPAPKNLLGIPWRTAFALQDDGWILRNAIVWSKPNAMPESVTDRLSTRHELLFLFSKSRRYWFDLDPIREPLLFPETTGHKFGGSNPEVGRRRGSTYKPRSADEPANAGTGLAPHSGYRGTHEVGRNPGDVWTIPTQPFPGAHFAVFPVEIPRRCIAAGCKPGGTVLDPFSGSGTTGLAAGQLGRKYVGVDLSRKYLDLSLETRLAQTALLDGGAA
jgi:DNA modification methylase